MLKTVVSYIDVLEAHIARGRLDAEGVPAYVAHDNHILAYWFLSNALGGVKVQVHPADVGRALDVLERTKKGEYQNILNELDDPQDNMICPRCSSDEIVNNSFGENISLIILWFFGIPIPYLQGKFKCKSCDEKWRSSEGLSYSIIVRVIAFLLITMLYILFIEGVYHVCRVKGINPICIY